jgi:nitrogen fixation protein NifU and related proteins
MTDGPSKGAEECHTPVDPKLEALYQEVILDHYRRPRNKGLLESATKTVDMKNPLCGDELTLSLRMDGDRIGDVKFNGRGCSISQASASMMTQLVKGKSLDEIAPLREKFRTMVMGKSPDGTPTGAPDKSLGEARALAGVAKFPARVRCALLAWNALGEALEEPEKESAN